jgi:hypothetical protein
VRLLWAGLVALAIGGCDVAVSPTAPGPEGPGTSPSTAAPERSPTPSARPSEPQRPSAAPASKVFEGFGFSFEYPGGWQEIQQYDHVGPHGPTIQAAVGTGGFEISCDGGSSALACSPTWTVPDDGVVLAYWFDRWSGVREPEPRPTLAPGASYEDVQGRVALKFEEPDRMTWRFEGAPEWIEARWGSSASNATVRDVEAAVASWTWDWLQPLGSPVAPPTDVLAGVLDLRPPGWTLIGDPAAGEGHPSTVAQVYGPTEGEVPPNEGPSRIVLYEDMDGQDGYFAERVAQSKASGGHAVAVEVYGQPAKAWANEGTGEVLIGWRRGSLFDVLVANLADYTVDQLVVAAHHVGSCCG